MDDADSDATEGADGLPAATPAADITPDADITLAADDLRAIADWRAGRVFDSDAVIRRLGGWQAMWSDAETSALPSPNRAGRLPPPTPLPATGPPDRGGAKSLLWTASAASECERLHAIIRTMSEDAAIRFAAAVVRTTVRLMVDGVGRQDGGERGGGERGNDVVQVALLPSLALRVLVTTDGIIVLGPHSVAPIT